MRILLMVKSDYGAVNKWASRNHFDLYRSLSVLAEFYHYGPNEQKLFGEEVAPLAYDEKHTMTDILKEIEPDVVITWGLPVCRGWLPPRDNYSLQIPFLCTTGDFFSIKQEERHWFNQWDLLLTRGSNIDTSDCSIPSVWVPLSVDEREFFTDPKSNYLKDREKKIVWIGNTSSFPYYKTRIAGIKELNTAGLLENIGLVGMGNIPADAKENLTSEQIKLISDSYAPKLKEYVGAFSCAGGVLHSTIAKHFEIMGSGTALLTQQFIGAEILFGKNQCYFTYEDDLSDLVSKANEIINDPSKVQEVTRNALMVINNNHCHHHRRVELFMILKALISGGEIPRRWGK